MATVIIHIRRRLVNPRPCDPLIPFWLLLLVHVVQTLVLTAIATSISLWLGGKVGLGAPLLRDWLAGRPTAAARFRSLLPPAILAGWLYWQRGLLAAIVALFSAGIVLHVLATPLLS